MGAGEPRSSQVGRVGVRLRSCRSRFRRAVSPPFPAHRRVVWNHLVEEFLLLFLRRMHVFRGLWQDVPRSSPRSYGCFWPSASSSVCQWPTLEQFSWHLLFSVRLTLSGLGPVLSGHYLARAVGTRGGAGTGGGLSPLIPAWQD